MAANPSSTPQLETSHPKPLASPRISNAKLEFCEAVSSASNVTDSDSGNFARDDCLSSQEDLETVELREANNFAKAIRERLKTGQLTTQERMQCIQYALRFARPERVDAVHRAVALSTPHLDSLQPPAHLPNSRLRVIRNPSRVLKHVACRRLQSRSPLGTIVESQCTEVLAS